MDLNGVDIDFLTEEEIQNLYNDVLDSDYLAGYSCPYGQITWYCTCSYDSFSTTYHRACYCWSYSGYTTIYNMNMSYCK